MNIKQEKYKKLRLQGLTQEQSKILAGYSPKTRASDIETPLKNDIINELNKAGLTNDILAQKLSDMALNGKKTLVISRGAELKEVQDNISQLKALEVISRLKGLNQENPTNINIDNRKILITDAKADKLEKICNTLLRLESRIKEGLDSEQSGEIIEGKV